MKQNLFLYILIMAGVTYLIRMLPLVLVKGKIRSRFLRSFLYYVPYAVLGAMTFPAIFYATASIPSAIAGTLIGVLLAFCERSLLLVAVSASAAAYLMQLLLDWWK